MHWKKPGDLFLIGGFLIGIAMPLLGALTGVGHRASAEEKRFLEPMPSLPRSLGEAETYPERFESWCNDNFGFRGEMIHLHNVLRHRLFPDSNELPVLVGRDGWLFFRRGGILDELRGSLRFSRADLEAWGEALERCQAWCEARGIIYLVCFAPNKHTVYPEMLPAHVPRSEADSPLDQLVKHLGKLGTVHFVDLRESLLRAKSEETVYYRYDTHWNDLGAHAAYRSILAELAKADDRLEPLGAEAFRLTHRMRPRGDLGGMLGMSSLLVERAPRLIREVPASLSRSPIPGAPMADGQRGYMAPFVISSGRTDLPTATVFRDSFFTGLVKFFAPHFATSRYHWQSRFDPALVEAAGADVVVHEIVERELIKLDPRLGLWGGPGRSGDAGK